MRPMFVLTFALLTGTACSSRTSYEEIAWGGGTITVEFAHPDGEPGLSGTLELAGASQGVLDASSPGDSGFSVVRQYTESGADFSSWEVIAYSPRLDGLTIDMPCVDDGSLEVIATYSAHSRPPGAKAFIILGSSSVHGRGALDLGPLPSSSGVTTGDITWESSCPEAVDGVLGTSTLTLSWSVDESITTTGILGGY